jgi:hypothetical protein
LTLISPPQGSLPWPPWLGQISYNVIPEPWAPVSTSYLSFDFTFIVINCLPNLSICLQELGC